eukprot:ANDGO_06141.mRNA.1 Glucosamine 6-phosphate N-acetyltransferase
MNNMPTNSDLVFRALSPSDPAHVVFPLLSQLTEAPTPSQEKFAMQIEEMRRRGIYTAVGEQNGEMLCIGSIAYEPKLIRGLRECGHIEDIVVHSKCRGLGYGNLLIEHLVAHAQNRGSVYKVILDCAKEKKGFYEKCGFQEKGLQMAKYL